VCRAGAFTLGAAASGTLTQCVQPAGYVLNNTDNCPSVANPSQADCNLNQIGDPCDLASQYSFDQNSNGVPDDCEFEAGDLDLDGVVSPSDLSRLMNSWGQTGPQPADLNRDGVVNSADMTILLNNWG
jgi:hypothetical protein